MQRLVGYKQKAVLALLSVYFRHYSIELDLVWGLKQQGNGKTGIDTQTRLKVTFLTPQAAVVDLDVEQTPPHKHSRTRTVHLCLLYCNSSCLMRAENNHLSLLPWQCPSCPMSISYLSFHSLLKQTLLSRCGMFSFYCTFIIWDIIHSDELQELQMANTSKNKSAKFTLFSKTR